MNLRSLFLSLFWCALIVLPTSIVFLHILTPNGMAFFSFSGLPHSLTDSQFWLVWLPWYGAFLFTSLICTWSALSCKRTCGLGNSSNTDDDDDYYDESSTPTGPRETGTVKWFNGKKGFGFITRGDGEDIFVHHRSIRSDGRGRRFLNEGQKVEYTITHKGKGTQAEDVVVI